MVKKTIFTLAMSLAAIGGMKAQMGQSPVDLEDIIYGQYYAHSAGYGIRSLTDGKHYSMLSHERNAILKYDFSTGQVVDTLFSTEKALNCDFKTFDNYQISADGKHILIYTEVEAIYRRSSKAKVFHYDVRRNRVEPLSEKDGKIMIPTFSPNGRIVAFVRDGNIFIKKFDFNTEVQVTKDGKANHIMNGVTDWVYEEEFSVTKLMSWSDDSSALAYVKTNESKVQEYRMPFYLGQDYPEDYVYKYPIPGTDNSTLSTHIYYVDKRQNKNIKLKAEDSYYIPRIEFNGQNKLAVMTLNRHQNNFSIFYVDAKSLVPKKIFNERNKCYVDSEHIQSLRFTKGGFAYISERSGFAQLYLFNHNGQIKQRITKGEWDVTQFYGLDAKGRAYYQAADRSPMQRSIYRSKSNGKGEELMAEGGTQDAIFSDSFDYFIGTHSSLNSPKLTAIYKTGKENPLRVLEDNRFLTMRLHSHKFNPKEFITVKTADDISLNGWIVKPNDFNPNKQYPLLMVQYSGPNSQQVLDQYSFGWEYYLASKGIIVACVDGRGTGARGEEWRKCTYLNLGVKESHDQIEAAKSLGTLPYIDSNRMAIWGWSFGGYNTLMSLCHGDGTFKLGIAVAPVTDWAFYDTIYTERYMRTPQENPKGYKASSVLEAAKNMKGQLLLIHGSADDNVHLQNTMQFTEELVQNNIPFDMAIYTDKNHGIYGGQTRLHLYSKMANYLLNNL